MAKAKAKTKRAEPKVKPQAVEKEWIEVDPERNCSFCGVTAPPRYDNRDQARCTACWERFPSEG